MRRILNALAIFVLVFMVPIAFAGTVTVSVTNPTTNTDGSAIPASGAGSIVSDRVEYGSCAGPAFGTKAGEVTITAPATSATLTQPPGTYCYRAFAKNTYGNESAASVVMTKVVPAPTPSPPTIVTIDVTALRILMPLNQFAFQRVGTVPLKTVCSSTQKINGYNVVDRAKVKWDGLIQPSVVVAKCAA
jgi:hypothetical protein